MNTPTLILAALVALPVILLMVMRVNAALVFLSLCLGNVLVEFVGPDANTFFDLFNKHASKGVSASQSTVTLVLLFLPVVLTTIFMIKTVRGPMRLTLNLLPALGVGLLTALLAIPLLPTSAARTIVDSPVWPQLQKSQDLIVGMSALLCLLVLWMQRPKAGEDKHGKKHHK